MRRGSEFTLYDGLGSVTKITDGSGTPSEQITLDAFGRTQNIGGSSADPYQYKDRPTVRLNAHQRTRDCGCNLKIRREHDGILLSMLLLRCYHAVNALVKRRYLKKPLIILTRDLPEGKLRHRLKIFASKPVEVPQP